MADLGVLAALVLAYALLQRRLERWDVSAPMAFVLAGLALGPSALDVVSFDLGSEAILLVAEVTLVIVLFTDASRIDVRVLRRNAALPARLLVVGLPLTILAGTAAGASLLPGLTFWEAAVLAVVLAPTDAALGQAVVENRVVPRRIRQTLNVESGLNDGLSVPFLAVALALAETEEDPGSAGFYIRFAAEQIGFGALVGVGVGAAGGLLIGRARARKQLDGVFRQLAVISLPIIAWAGAEAIDGNGFIAAFVAGLAAGTTVPPGRTGALHFAVEEGRLLNLATFFIFGAAIAGPVLGDTDWRVLVYALASLTVIRMVPVAVALVGARLRPVTTLFVGWFGPRGIASIVLSLVVVERSNLDGGELIGLAASVTILASVIAHGASASPLARRYGRRAERLEAESPEMAGAPDLPTRYGTPQHRHPPPGG